MTPLLDDRAADRPERAARAVRGDRRAARRRAHGRLRAGRPRGPARPRDASRPRRRCSRSGSPFLQIRSAGGAVNDLDPMATAYAHRTQNFSVSAQPRPRGWDELMAPLLNGLYLSFDTDQRPERLLDAFPEPTLSRLRELKAIYDPDNVFNQNFPIPPAVHAAAGPGRRLLCRTSPCTATATAGPSSKRAPSHPPANTRPRAADAADRHLALAARFDRSSMTRARLHGRRTESDPMATSVGRNRVLTTSRRLLQIGAAGPVERLTGGVRAGAPGGHLRVGTASRSRDRRRVCPWPRDVAVW